jgi:hypothetical protein
MARCGDNGEENFLDEPVHNWREHILWSWIEQPSGRTLQLGLCIHSNLPSLRDIGDKPILPFPWAGYGAISGGGGDSQFLVDSAFGNACARLWQICQIFTANYIRVHHPPWQGLQDSYWLVCSKYSKLLSIAQSC